MVKDVVKRYVIQEGFQLKKLKNDRLSYIVRYKNETCKWGFYASCLPDGVTFMIRNVVEVHTFCQRTNRNKEANSKWVATVLQNNILANPSIVTKDLKNQLQEKYVVRCAIQTIYRAKIRVLKTLTVDHVNSYVKIKKYANAVIVMNCKTKEKGCRPLIGVDGCHLTGEFGGIMLSAIALDADSVIFPIAFCICEVKNTDTWVWFLRLLSEALNWDDSVPICFINDRQKGLTNALKYTWPRAGKRHCCRHIIANFNATYKNLNMTGKLWAVSRSGDAAEFKAIMESIREESDQAYNYLMKAKPKRWARHTFDQ
ncbi:hypothetical protein Ddye_023785 [Dipteronia dyeriana]|uniref:MULE transposase domain-containing protein n=1 Tax=Dipteronia dyeriana TaxID=168575 RepID=A0AAD9TTL1_9ROSI|nr:hypothetical protein Ddye_023785 [Dipteronia dyeriana]